MRQTRCVKVRWLAAVVVAVVVATSGCTGGSSDESGRTGSSDSRPTSPSGVHVGIRATVVQQRADVGTTRIGLELTTDRRTTIHVDGVQLLSDAFEEQPMTAKDTDFSPERTIDLTVDYGTPVCTPDVSVDDAEVLVHYTAGEAEASATLPVAALGRDLLSHLHIAGCARQRLDAAAALTYRTPFRRQVVDGRLSLLGSLELKRPAAGGSGESVTVESVFGSVLFVFEVRRGAGNPGVLEPGDSSTRVPVVISGNNRCSPHERSASQQTFVFTADVRVGSSALHRQIIEPPTPLRVQAMALLSDVC